MAIQSQKGKFGIQLERPEMRKEEEISSLELNVVTVSKYFST